ncbi:MAG: class I SAM-dependent methyltransferase [Bacteroidales bacterium]|nr:class I SAM-dependent methyltransferase [Bacteroidales bacterium]
MCIIYSIKRLINKIFISLFPPSIFKLHFEYFYWRFKRIFVKKFSNIHFKHFFPEYFNLDYEFYNNKRILDIGCGPRGSLEWADNSEIRIGLDPLVKKYKNFGIEKHKMTYIEGVAERIPFKDNFFDIISSFNSFDHFDDINKALFEIIRILKPNGLFLLIVDFRNYPRICEPSLLTNQFLEMVKSYFQFHQINKIKGNRMYKSLRRNITNKNNKEKDVIISAIFQK